MQRPPSDSEESSFGRHREYRGGSFEVPLQTDRKPELHLERPPSFEAMPKEELQDMVPEFMHRDFYRSVEGNPIAFPSQERPLPPSLGSNFKARRLPKRTPKFVRGGRGGAFETPQTEPPLEEGFFDPYQESDEFEGLDLKETVSVGLPPLPPEETAPEPDPPRASAHRAPPEEKAKAAPKAAPKAPPLAPLRSGKSDPPEPGAALSSLGKNVAKSETKGVPVQARASEPTSGETPISPPGAASKSSWAAPLLVALLVLSAVFVWREYERQAVVAASTVTVPTSVPQEEHAAEKRSQLDFEESEGLSPGERLSQEQRAEEALMTEDGNAESGLDEGLAAGAPAQAGGGSTEAVATGRTAGSVLGDPASPVNSPDPADLFPETAPSAPATAVTAAAPPAPAAPDRGSAADRERRLQSGNALFPDESSGGGTAAGADAAGLFPQVPEAPPAPQPAAAPPSDSGGADLFPATREAPPSSPPPTAVGVETRAPAPVSAPVGEAVISAPEAVLPPPVLPGQKPKAPARPSATDASKYHISEPSL